MDVGSSHSVQPFRFNFSAALGLAQQAHAVATEVSEADVFSLLKLDRASIARELPSIASTPAAVLGYTATPHWKIWQDYDLP
jgi:hypothetical protein